MHIGTRHHKYDPDSGHKVLWNGRERIDILYVDDEKRMSLKSNVLANLSGLRKEQGHPQAQRGLCIYQKVLRPCGLYRKRGIYSLGKNPEGDWSGR